MIANTMYVILLIYTTIGVGLAHLSAKGRALVGAALELGLRK